MQQTKQDPNREKPPDLDAASVARALRNADRLPSESRDSVHRLTFQWLFTRALTERTLRQRIALTRDLEQLQTLAPDFEPDAITQMIATQRRWRRIAHAAISASFAVVVMLVFGILVAVTQSEPLLAVGALVTLAPIVWIRQLLLARDRRSRRMLHEYTPRAERYTPVMHNVTHMLAAPPPRGPVIRASPRIRARSREHRPAARRRAGASSRTASADPGDSDSDSASSPPPLRLRRTRYGLVSPRLLDLLVWTEATS